MFLTFNSTTDNDYFENIYLILTCFSFILRFMFTRANENTQLLGFDLEITLPLKRFRQISPTYPWESNFFKNRWRNLSMFS